MAVEEASFRTEIWSMSFGFRFASEPSMPSMITSGLLSFIVLKPRMFIEGVPPGVDEPCWMTRPGVVPWRPSRTLAMGLPSSSWVETEETAPVRLTFFWTP